MKAAVSLDLYPVFAMERQNVLAPLAFRSSDISCEHCAKADFLCPAVLFQYSFHH
jgi:hypothetical protein